MRFLRISFVILMCLLAMPIVTFFVYDLFYFQPYTSQVKSIIANASPEDREPPILVARFVSASEIDGIDSQLPRIIFHRINVESSNSVFGSPIAQEILWQQLISLHLTNQERMSLYCSLIYSGNNDPGLSAASERLYNKPLSKLSAPEAATVVALLQGPSYYEKRPEMLAKRRDVLLERLKIGF